ncbi:MAG: penicillin-binding protein 1A [Chitinophagales bacterium]|nr:MAG: penicillin-binding protein 1A [Chitinophagales bacterium]
MVNPSDAVLHPNQRVTLALLMRKRFAGIPIVCLCALLLHGCIGTIPSEDELKKIKNHTASEVYSADGVLLGRYFIQHRTHVNLASVPPFVIQALIATEDARFYSHQGVDTRSLLRVLVKTILLNDERSGGGSTLSQQLAKNLYPRKKEFLGLLRSKIREAVIAQRLEKLYTKEELLELYLNTVPFGEEVFGIGTAAERYFGVKPAELNVQQAAMLVGMLKAPSFYHPKNNPQQALQRRNVVLSQMAKYGYLSPKEADSIKALPLEIRYTRLTHETGLAPYFREMLRLYLDSLLTAYNRQHTTHYNLYTDGLKIYTTLHAGMQRYAEKAVQEHLRRLQRKLDAQWSKEKPWDKYPNLLTEAVKNAPRYQQLKARGLTHKEIEKTMATPAEIRMFSWDNADTVVRISPLDSVKYALMLLHCGLVAMEPRTGAVRAWVGGINYAHFKYDHVLARRQVGSTFKPVLYATALEHGVHPCDRFPNERIVFPEYDNWSPKNADDYYGGYYSMRGALAYSVNTVSAQLIQQTGIRPVIALAHKLGIRSTLPEVPAIALGAVEIPLLEMTTAYCAFANGGYRVVPYFLVRVEDNKGRVLFNYTPPVPQQVLQPATAQLITLFLETVVDSGTARALRTQFGFHNDLAGKTGTTQNNSDGWFIGYNPALVCGVWTGAQFPAVHFKSTAEGQGAKTALPVWGRFAKLLQQDQQLSGLLKHTFPEPDARLIAMTDCLLYQEYDNFWERLFSRKPTKPKDKRGKTEAPAPSSFKERVKKFFRGKKSER